MAPHRIRLAYLAADDATSIDEAEAMEGEREIRTAVSPDGKHFFYEGVRFAQEGITAPDLFLSSSSEFVLFTTVGQSLVKATSNRPDGEYLKSGSFASPLVSKSSSLRLPDGTVRTFSCGVGGIVSSLYSPVTGTLTQEGTALVHSHETGILCDPAVAALGDGTYFMTYSYHSTNSEPGIRGDDLYGAISTDGANFESTGTLLRASAATPGVVALGRQIYLYFVDGTGELNSTGSIAMGTSYDGGATFNFQEVCMGEWQVQGVFDPAGSLIE